MKPINYNQEKSDLLKAIRGISLKEVAEMVVNNINIIEIIENQNYTNQSYFVLNINNYIWFCPFVETDSEIFLKTVFPNRKANKKYKGE